MKAISEIDFKSCLQQSVSDIPKPGSRVSPQEAPNLVQPLGRGLGTFDIAVEITETPKAPSAMQRLGSRNCERFEMTSRTPRTRRRSDLDRAAGKRLRLARLGIAAAATFTLALTGCSDPKKDKAASQTAARVNQEEVTVHQINQLLQQQRGLKPEQLDTASRQILELLVDQELAVQRTRELKIDQDPRVMLQVDAAKREVLARAYAEKTGEAAAKPSADEVKKYFDTQPSLFKNRRVYNLQELTIQATPAQVTALREQLQRNKSANDLVQYLKANDLRFSADQGVRPAEQLPANVLESVTTMSDGQMVLLPSPAGARVLLLAGSRSEPFDEARAGPAIEQFLLVEARRKLVETDVKALRAGAKIEYVGKFAQAAGSAAGVGPAPPAMPASAASAAAARAVTAAAPTAAAASAMSADDISKGMGIKK